MNLVIIRSFVPSGENWLQWKILVLWKKVFFFKLEMKRNLANDNAQRSVITAILDDCNRVTI